MHFTPVPTPLDELNNPLFDEHKVKVFVKRFDLLHPYISGNKWWKLKYNFIEAREQNKDKILTFGGAFSNHIAAAACLGRDYEWKTVGIIRGEEHLPLNPVLRFAKECGMKLHYVDRETYRLKATNEFLSFLSKQFGDFFLIPEGGANAFGVEGCKEMINEMGIDFDYVCCDCGTGTTLAGLALSLKEHQQAIGIPVLQGAEFLEEKIKELQNKYIRTFNDRALRNNLKLFYDYHFGGFAKSTDELDSFVNNFNQSHSIKLEYIYSGKLFYAIFDLIRKGYIKENSTIIILHTGGILSFPS